MRIRRIDAPGQTVLRFVVTLVRNRKLNSMKRLIEGFHHGEDNVLVIVFLNTREIEIR